MSQKLCIQPYCAVKGHTENKIHSLYTLEMYLKFKEKLLICFHIIPG